MERLGGPRPAERQGGPDAYQSVGEGERLGQWQASVGAGGQAGRAGGLELSTARLRAIRQYSAPADWAK